MSRLRILRVYHDAGVDAGRERALLAAGVELTVVLPAQWPGAADPLTDVPHRRLAVRRPGDVNRHRHASSDEVRRVLDDVRPDVLDLHEEPVSLVARQWLRAAADVPVVMYTAQNVDKRWPPPFEQYERAALRRVAAFYPCSRQAASVLRGKGFRGLLRVLPLGIDPLVHRLGEQSLPATELVLGCVGRLIPEKGVLDAVRVLAAVHRSHPARLIVVGEGPEGDAARALACQLGIADRCTWLPWRPADELAATYRRMHVVLVPSRATSRWVEQFGRVIVEGRANGAVPVGYASGSIPEVVGAGGVVVPEGDVDGLATAVLELARDPARWASLRARAVASWTHVARDHVQLYDEVLRTRWETPLRATARTRAAAVAELGPPAETPAGRRPFALPILRADGPVPRALGRAVDVLTGQR